MSVKLETPRDAFNFMKEKCTSFATQAASDPALAAKIVVSILGVVAAVLWLSIILYKHRKARLLNVRKPPVSRKRNAESHKSSRRNSR